MFARLRSIIDLRKGEVALTTAMFSTYYLLLVTYYFLKPARDSLFLTKVDPKLLPVVFIITALVTVPVIGIYNRLGGKLKLNQLIGVTYLFIIANLFGLWFLIQRDEPWIYYLFYTWVSIYGALTTSQFWLLANTVYDSSQSKRIFALLGLGGIIGAFTGGEVSGLVLGTFDIAIENLLFICMALLGLAFLLVNTVWSIKQRQDSNFAGSSSTGKKSKESLRQLFRTVKSSRHLALIVGIIAMTMMVASFVDYQFKVISSESFSSANELAAFLGTFYGRLSLVSFILQIFLAQKLLRVLGVGGVIMFLPIGLMLGSVAMFVLPGLAAAVMLRGADGAIKYSLDKTSRELLILPIPLAIKKRTKMFIDMFVDRWFRGLAGALLLLCTLVFELSIRQISLVVIVLIAVWLFLALLIRKEYVNAFRKAIEKRQIDPDQITFDIAESSVLETLRLSLKSGNEREIIYALDTLSGVKDESLVEPCLALLKNRSSEVRYKAIRLLTINGNDDLIKPIKSLLNDESLEVRRESIHFHCVHNDNAESSPLESFLAHPEQPVRLAALASIVEYGDESDQLLVNDEVVNSFLNDHSEHGVSSRVQIAKALGKLSNPDLYKHFTRLLNASEPEVVKTALHSIGHTKVMLHVPFLINKLADPVFRSEARSSLALFGKPLLGTLKDYLGDDRIDIRVRHQIPRVLSSIPTQESADILTSVVSGIDSRFQFHILRALNKLRVSYPGLKLDNKRLTAAIINETKRYYELAQILDKQAADDDNPGRELLKRALVEKQDHNLERIFRLMGLHYPAGDIHSAYLGLISRKKELRSNAIEFLDNLLTSDVKKYIFPIIDEVSPRETINSGRELFGLNIKTYEDGLISLIEGRDPWLRACAIYNADIVKYPDFLRIIEKAQHDTDPVVREVAVKIFNEKGRQRDAAG